MIIGLFTQLKGSGGIQRVGRHLSEAISEMSSDQHVPYAILSLADERGWHELTANGQHVIFRALVTTISLSWRQPQRACVMPRWRLSDTSSYSLSRSLQE